MSDPTEAEARVPLCEPSLGGNARRYLDECLTSGFVSSVGPFVDRFAAAFAARVGARFAVPCASGTAALHLACRLAEISTGDEVFVSTLTFIASANPIRYEHATPVLIDAEAETLNLDPNLIIAELDRRARTGQTQPKAVIAVHILGQPARLDQLGRACERHGVTLIEDAAEALGACYRGGRLGAREVGTVGKFGCYSFNGNKIITAGGGGMLTCDDERLAQRARHLSTQARLPGADGEYRHDEVGYNYRLTNLAAALGLAQLEQLDGFLDRKRAIAARYDAAFAGVPGLRVPVTVPWALGSRWLYTLEIEAGQTARAGVDRQVVAAELRGRQIDSRPIWTPLHLLPPFADAPRIGGATAEAIFARGLCLPSGVELSPRQQDRVIGAVLTAVGAR